MTNPPAAGTVIYPDLAGKVAVVTGGSRGIGAATASALAANAVDVAVVSRDRSAITSVVTRITSSGGRAIGVVADCTVEADLAALRQEVDAAFGSVDIVLPFAGGDGMPV